MRTERPPEEWLLKAYDGDVLIDLIHHPRGLSVDDAIFDRAEEMAVLAVTVPVMALEDVLVAKLLALDEQRELDYTSLLAIARSLREQIDWDAVRERTSHSPYAKAFFTLVEELGLTQTSVAS
jgi:predicted nucleotidyltransferase